MNELVKALRQFLVRDVVFILGGSEVIAAFLYLFDRLPSDLSIPAALLWAGFAYVLGYVVQDTASLLRIVRTQQRARANWFQKLIFRAFERRELPAPKSGEQLDRMRAVVRANCSQRVYAEIERNSALKQIGTTMGPSSLVSALLLAIRALQTSEVFDLTLAVVLAVLGALLVTFGWLKVTQQALQIELHYTLLPENERLYIEHDAGSPPPSVR